MTQTTSSHDKPLDIDPQSDLTATRITITEKELPLHCPGSKSPLWSMHPRVYLDILTTGSVECPYCGVHYDLEPGTKAPDHPH
ncbi:zinc-finger domain-containing protein [Orrella sp. 11846]|uniref:zinc-finger domain-containing protein n=1 Tax=Orrella sp. 11846 TaxID=3409913 RepID=UPI003B5C400A